jgi:hypothetical protein
MFLRVHCLRDLGCIAVLSGIFCCSLQTGFSLPITGSARSVSGQFIVTGAFQSSLLFTTPGIVTDTNFVRLEPALLAVSAERVRETVWRELGINGPWRGKIFLMLRPAQSPNDDVTIVSKRLADGWGYYVLLPDVLSHTHFARAMVSVVLLEFANRNASTRSAEIPGWLTDGLSQQLLATDWREIILSSPSSNMNGLLESHTVGNHYDMDVLAGARRVLCDYPALTFEQLSWPTDAQLSGADGGVYRASAQLFVNELLDLKNGPAHLRTMLQSLPHFYNWQTAFQNAFGADFSRPLDLEKWWALQVVSFAARDPGSRWTPAVSREKLDEILSVPVEMRTASNALPTRASISLQAVIRSFDSGRQTEILQTKLRDFEVAQFRMAPQLAVLTAEYRMALADYLGENKPAAPVWNKHAPVYSKASPRDTLKKLDALDVERRTIEAAIKPDFLRP